MELVSELKNFNLAENVSNSLQKTLDNVADKDVAISKNEELGVNKTIDKFLKNYDKNVDKEVAKDQKSESSLSKATNGKLKEILKVGAETALKVALKTKLGVNFSTFDCMKKAVTKAMDGDFKSAIKSASNGAVDQMVPLNSTYKSAIKTIKNSIIDNTIDNQKYQIINRQTKLVNRIEKNCDKFNEALSKNDEVNIKKSATSIKRDMKEILPIREVINNAQNVLDKYELWKNKGNTSLTNEENELIEKLNKSA